MLVRVAVFAAVATFCCSCGSTSGAKPTPTTIAATSSSLVVSTSTTVPESTSLPATTTQPPGAPLTLAGIAAIACDVAPTRMGKDAEVFTEQSWTCSLGGEHVRIDLGFDQNTTRDSVIVKFATAGVGATTCGP